MELEVKRKALYPAVGHSRGLNIIITIHVLSEIPICSVFNDIYAILGFVHAVTIKSKSSR